MPTGKKNVRVIKVDLPDEVEFTPPPMVYQITKEQLIELYYGERKSVRQIASELGRGATTIRRWMEKYNIPRRNYSDATILHHDKLREKEEE